MGVFCFQVGGHQRRPSLASFFFVFIMCYGIFCYGCMVTFVVLDLYSTKPIDWWEERHRNDIVSVRWSSAQSVCTQGYI